jgi:hypothetical protein
LSGLNALGVQQLLAASSQNSLANTQGKKTKTRKQQDQAKINISILILLTSFLSFSLHNDFSFPFVCLFVVSSLLNAKTFVFFVVVDFWQPLYKVWPTYRVRPDWE